MDQSINVGDKIWRQICQILANDVRILTSWILRAKRKIHRQTADRQHDNVNLSETIILKHYAFSTNYWFIFSRS